MSETQPTVCLSSGFNSTMFTTCCGCAISDQPECPRCKRTILPVTKDARWAHARGMQRIRAKEATDRCATGHDWVRRGEGSCGDRYVCLRCGERKP